MNLEISDQTVPLSTESNHIKSVKVNKVIYDYYDILGLKRDDPADVIIKQYKKSIVMAEFERHSQDGLEQIMEVTEAYIVLSEPDRRSLYNRTVDEEDLTLISRWKPAIPVESDLIFSEVFASEVIEKLFQPSCYFTPLGYLIGSLLGFILLSWSGMAIVGYLGGQWGNREDRRAPPAYQLMKGASDNQRTALLHSLSKSILR